MQTSILQPLQLYNLLMFKHLCFRTLSIQIGTEVYLMGHLDFFGLSFKSNWPLLPALTHNAAL